MNNTIKRTWNQGSMVNIEDLRGMTFQAESGGHTFVISAVDADGNAVALSGTPAGTMLRPDNTDQALTCSISGGKVYATLPAGCYDVPGRAGITIFLTSGGQKAAIYAAVVSVTRTQSGTASPGTTASVVDLVNAINTAISGIPATDTALKAAMAPTYSNSALYAVGEYAWYNGTLYRCTTAITTAETWTSGHWTAAAIGTDSANGLRELKSAINTEHIYSEKLTANSRWPRLIMPVSDGHSYFLRIISVIGQSGYDQIWAVQGTSVSLTGDIKDGSTAILTPSGSDPVYLTVRYPSEPSSTPVVVYELIDVTEKTSELKSREIVITSDNKSTICSGDADNLPNNSIYGVNSGAGLTHAPFTGSYYLIVTMGEKVKGTTSKAQIAFTNNLSSMAYRVNNSVSWTDWVHIERTIMAKDTIITSDNKAAICSGDANNLGRNTIYGVNSGAALTHAPFTGAYYTVMTFSEKPTGTAAVVQIAFTNDGSRFAYRSHNSVAWTDWVDLKTLIYSVQNEILGADNLYYQQTSPNTKYPRIILPVTNGNAYYIRVLAIVSDDTPVGCYANTSSATLATGLADHAAKLLAPTTNDTVYLTVEYSETPSKLPYVLYMLESAETHNRVVTRSDQAITADTMEKICESDIDNLPLNSIFGHVGGIANLEHQPFYKNDAQILTLGKYLSRTTGDMQFALKAKDGSLAFRSYFSGTFPLWNYVTPVSRYPGLKVSIIGDSISSYKQEGYHLDGYNLAYPYADVTSVEETWWCKVIQASGAKLDKNASWSGSCASNKFASSGYPDFYDRCALLGNPDTIFVELGTNDSLQEVDLGEYDYDTAYTSLSEDTFRPAYIKGIKALKNNYPNAQIVCVILAMDDGYANSIKAIAEELNCDVVECRDYKIYGNTFHPGILGMRQIASRVLYPNG